MLVGTKVQMSFGTWIAVMQRVSWYKLWLQPLYYVYSPTEGAIHNEHMVNIIMFFFSYHSITALLGLGTFLSNILKNAWVHPLRTLIDKKKSVQKYDISVGQITIRC